MDPSPTRSTVIEEFEPRPRTEDDLPAIPRPASLPELLVTSAVTVTLIAIAIRFALRAPGGWIGRLAALGFTALAASLPLLGDARISALRWPGGLLIALGFLLGAPVFVAMAGLAMLLFFTQGTPIAP